MWSLPFLYGYIFNMKFVCNIYVLIIVLRFTRIVQNAADFTIDELTHLSRKLNPMECMRLLEAIYSAIPKEKEHRIISPRETPMHKWVSNQACLNELKTWNQQFPDKAEPKARDVMTLHLNAAGRADLANYLCKKDDVGKKNGKISKDQVFKRDANDRRTDHRSRTKRINRGVERFNVHHSMISAISGGATSSFGQSGPGKNQPRKPQRVNVSKNSLYLIIALGIVVLFICGIVFLIFRRSLRSSPCLGERSDLCPGNNLTQEKGLQCIRCLNDHDVYETRSNLTSQISEIDVEGGSCFNSLSAGSRRSFSPVSCVDQRTVPGISVEELELYDEDLETESPGEALPQSSCRCRPLEKKICGAKPVKKKKKKKKTKSKSREETKTKSYLRAMQEKILPRQRRQFKKESNFDMKQFQEKILAVLNQDCATCRCCNCTPHWEVDSPKVSRSGRKEKGCVKRERKDCKRKQPKQQRCEKSSMPKCCEKEALTYQTSASSGSPTSSRRSTRRQESDSAKKGKIQRKEKSVKSSSPRVGKTGDNRVLVSASSSSGMDRSYTGSKDNSKRSKQREASANTLPGAHDKPKRFF